MAANSQGIQTLLEAEKEASKVVTKARQYRVQKLKDARTEAAKEIEEYKAQKEAEFNKFESEHTSHKSTSQSTIDESTKKQLAEVEDSMKKNRGAALQKVVDRVLSVEPKLHPNLKKVEA
ncbi:V-type ATPase [Cutaneotrichosporon oleaginosum]|uniref:V-type proton ATPase subunit G n=1 Tax=Cutaneotrichosporon oleaginosum TaxID=879819 RepID=A0A0J1AU41_9TREE|nr:V-type ATPase [Cutaneotrichosporon oleaginosum]KLT38824.1 V-type ATPase [Cutaneotrichosporon oleaginosum]